MFLQGEKENVSIFKVNADRAKAKATSHFGLGCHSINLCSPSRDFAFAFTFTPMGPEAIK